MKHLKHFLAVFVLAALAPFRAAIPQPIADTSSYFPLRIGYQWTYSSEPYSITQEISDTATLNGHLFYGMSWLGYPPSTWFRTFSDSVFVMRSPGDSNESLLYNLNANVGDTVKLPLGYYDCTFGNLVILAGKEDAISTPSGTYTHCYHFKHVSDCRDGGMHDSWLAKGIGIVKYTEEKIWGSPTYTLDSFRLVAPEGNLLQYYPLQTSDYWEYEKVSYDDEPPFETDTSAYSVEAIGDTLFPNGFHYETMTYENPYTGQYGVRFYERVDSSNGNVFMYDSTWANGERLIDSLFAKPGNRFLSSGQNAGFSNSFNTFSVCVQDDTILGVATKIRYFTTDYMFEYSYTLAKSLGLYQLSSEWDFGYATITLVYAKVDGKEYGTKIPTGVADRHAIPTAFALFQNYPNPFNPNTTINYQLPMTTHVTLKVYDVLGREVATLVDERQTAGNHSVVFSAIGGSASGGNARSLPSGVYFYKISLGGTVSTKKMVLVK